MSVIAYDAGKQDGINEERERILAILEDWLYDDDGDFDDALDKIKKGTK